jgi:DNA helicase-2/ATP-dependent DNA helicase PcrA
METTSGIEAILADLNPQQRAAAISGALPLLIVAGAGTGKTATLVHRVAWLIAGGAVPSRILLLTFTRRAAAEMDRRVGSVLSRLRGDRGVGPAIGPGRIWGGTFHAIAMRLLRRFGKAIGLPAEFVIHDRSDSEDLIQVVRSELGLAKTDRRFPHKGTCMAIYSRCVNSREKLGQVLDTRFPWCHDDADDLKRLFDAYVDRKETAGILDYDDLLVYWHSLLTDPEAGPQVRALFDHVLVDEYQDTNVLQAEILYALRPDGRGLTVVGDDAQAIYSFRAASIRNILDFPKHYPDSVHITLEQNYRSTQPILEASNRVIAQAKHRFTKNLWSHRGEGEPPRLVTCESEDDQAEFLVQKILEHRESGLALHRQAVLFRASHHSIRRNIPFHKYGGLKFIETAHVKDAMAFLRLAENPRDVVSGSRLLALLPGVGPQKARQLMTILIDALGDFSAWRDWKPPAATAKTWPSLVALLMSLSLEKLDLSAQVNRVRRFYEPMLRDLYDYPQARARDIEQIELIASRYRNRQDMLAEITLDPPASTQDLAGPPVRDDDYLVLSTIHSAKGLEWDAVYVIHAADGNIPSDMSTGTPEDIEEELRLFYVAMTRAKRALYVCYPLRYYHYRNASDRHGYAQLTRFLTPSVLAHFQRIVATAAGDADEPAIDFTAQTHSRSIRKQTTRLWDG